MIDNNILIQFVKGDKAAFDKIYAAYSSSMYTICLRYVRCADDAQDILQESFIKLYKTRETFNPEQSIGAWLKTITIRTALTYIKKTYKLKLTDDESMLDQPIENLESEDNSKELMQKLMTILQELPDGYRTIFNLFAIENMTHTEIAEYLEISVGTSKSQFFKAKKMIQAMLEQDKLVR